MAEGSGGRLREKVMGSHRLGCAVIFSRMSSKLMTIAAVFNFYFWPLLQGSPLPKSFVGLGVILQTAEI